MDFNIEIVKSMGSETLSDEVYPMVQCPECGADIASAFNYCPSCGNGPLEGGEAFRTCENKSSEPTFFLCSECGRLYVPVQVVKGGGEIEWNCCPGCMAVVA